MTDALPTNAEAVDIIERLGGNAKTAELCEVSPSAVSQWVRNGIPRVRTKFLRLARPDAFVPRGDVVKSAAAPSVTTGSTLTNHQE
jgi:DNA-binding transcriptional regulator YdaS (Cro superfamily)